MADYRDYDWEEAADRRRAEEQRIKIHLRRQRVFKDLLKYLEDFPEDAELLRAVLLEPYIMLYKQGRLPSTTPDVVE